MKFGYFDDNNREYVITTPKTPLPWINYLGSRDFFTLLSNTGGGYSFYKDARLLRLTRYRYNDMPLDGNGKYFYIKDGDTAWNPGWLPTRTDLDAYECRHGMGYTRFVSEKNGLEASLLCFVPLFDACELMQLTLTNRSAEVKRPKVFSYVEWCLWDADDDQKNFQRNFSTGEVEVESTLGYQISGRNKPAGAADIDCSGIDYTAVYHRTEYRERRSHFAVFSLNAPADGYDTDRAAFIGSYRGPQDPEVVERGACTGSVAMGWSPVAVLEKDLVLAPGESRTLVFQLSYIENDPADKWESYGISKRTGRTRSCANITMYRPSRMPSRSSAPTGAPSSPATEWRAHIRRSTAWSTSGTSTSAWSPSTCPAAPPITSPASGGAWASATAARTCWASST